jgi:glycosyltransferase involved in cell wall biosynthesis
VKYVPRIALFSPLPPSQTGIADYCAELLPELAKHLNVTIFTDEPASVDEPLRRRFPVYETGSYALRRWDFDLALYHMGNSAFHDAMYRVFLRYPGVVVLHDYGLLQFMAYRTLSQGDITGYLREFGYALGVEGVYSLRDSLMHGRPYAFTAPLNDRLLDLSLGLIVHSQYTRNQVWQHSPRLPVEVIRAPIMQGHIAHPYQVPGWPADAVILASVGQATAAKQLDQALRAFKRVLETAPQARYLVVGGWLPAEVNPPLLIEQLGLGDTVHCTGRIENMPEFVDWVASADIVVNLRNPTVGETSAAALRAMAAGRPLIVSDHGWYAELPEDSCIKVPPADEEALYVAMRRLVSEPALRQAMGARAAHHAAEMHSPASAAAAYARFIGQVLSNLDRRLIERSR